MAILVVFILLLRLLLPLLGVEKASAIFLYAESREGASDEIADTKTIMTAVLLQSLQRDGRTYVRLLQPVRPSLPRQSFSTKSDDGEG